MTAADLGERRHDRPDAARLPLEPLLDALPIDRCLERRDVVGPGAIAGGLHPLVVWGEAWIDAIDDGRGFQARETPGPYDRSSLSR